MIPASRELMADLEALRGAAAATTRDLRGLRGEVGRPIGAGRFGVGGIGIGAGMGLEGLGIGPGAQGMRMQSSRMRAGLEKFNRFSGLAAMGVGLASGDMLTSVLGVASTIPGPVGVAAAVGMTATMVYNRIAEYIQTQKDYTQTQKEFGKAALEKQTFLRREDFKSFEQYERVRGYANEAEAKKAVWQRTLDLISVDNETRRAADEELRRHYEQYMERYMEKYSPYQASRLALNDVANMVMERERRAWEKALEHRQKAEELMSQGLLLKARENAQIMRVEAEKRYDRELGPMEKLALVENYKRAKSIVDDPLGAYQRAEARRTSKRHRVRWQMYFASSRTGD